MKIVSVVAASAVAVIFASQAFAQGFPGICPISGPDSGVASGSPHSGDPMVICGCVRGGPITGTGVGAAIPAPGGPGGTPPPMYYPPIHCPPIKPIDPEPDVDLTGLVGGSAGSANNAAGGALGQSLRQRGDDGTQQRSRNRLNFTSASDRSNGNWTVWGDITASNFDGTLDGDGASLTVGVDTKVTPNLLLGAMISYGKYDFYLGGVPIESKALSYGPYISASITDKYNFNAYVLFASPEYTGGGVVTKTDRVSGGVSVDATYVLGKAEAKSYVSISGFSEKVPAAAPGGARTITNVVGSIGTRLDFAIGSATRPYILIAAESIRYKTGATTLNSFSPRLGVGVEHNFSTGSVSFGIEGGEVFEGARDVSAKLGLSMEF